MLNEVIGSLKETPKRIPSKYFYDEVGSKLFDEICELEEYYPTRTETKILLDNVDEIVEAIPNDVVLIEFGSGSSIKTKILLKHMMHLKAYVPVDISEEHLYSSVAALKKEYPQFNIKPLSADYTKPFVIPTFSDNENRVIFFPGSTIGNFTKEEVREFLHSIRNECGGKGSLLIGIDLVKDKSLLTAAYNDRVGVTALFNLNILKVLNKTLETNFDICNFYHSAEYNDTEQRIEMYLISNREQSVKIKDMFFHIEKDEKILTEYSHKYTIEGFENMCEGYFRLSDYWTDENKYFAVLLMKAI